MYVRDAKNRDEVWMLDRIEELGFEDPAFRSRDYVIALDEETGQKAGFGRYRIHKDDAGVESCELTAIAVLPEWRNEGVGAHVVERLVEKTRDMGFEEVYALTGTAGYLVQFGFETIPEDELPGPLRERLETVRGRVDPDATPLRLRVADFEMPRRLRERFKHAAEGEEERVPEETPEDFGIDPESATYKYDTGRH